MRRYAQTALLILLGGMLLKLALTGTYIRYVREVHVAFLLLAGLALLAVAGVTLWRDARALGRPDEEPTAPMRLGGFFGTAVLSAPDRTGGTPPVSAAEPATGGGGDTTGEASTVEQRALAAGLAAAEHEGVTGEQDAARADTWLSAGRSRVEGLLRADVPTAAFDTVSGPTSDPFDTAAQPPADGPAEPVGGTRGGWALLVLALAVLVLSPPALGTYPALRYGTVNPGSDLTEVPAGDPVQMSLVDYAAHALAGGEQLAGRRVRLLGFVVLGPVGEPYLTRLTTGCCAASARPVKIGITGDLSGVLSPGAWVWVVGTYTDRVDADPVNGAPIPYVLVEQAVGADEPADPYEP